MLAYANEPIIKTRGALWREAAEVPSDLRATREELAFDFGKFDYAIVDGETILYDTNRTPMMRSADRAEKASEIRLLASGISVFD